jgi:aminoglycoside phosphotransferase (APT) family kinase protein
VAHFEVQEILRRLADDDPLRLGPVRWRARRLETRRYSGIWILELEGDTALLRERAGGAALVLKIYRAAHAARRQREFDDLRRVHAALGPGAGIPTPVACYADRGAVITGHVSGLPLAGLVRRACRRTADGACLARAAALSAAAGEWLRAFQARGFEAMRDHRPGALGEPRTFLAYVDERLALLAAARPGIGPALRQRLLAQAGSALQALAPGRLATVTWSHADFGPHNILADGDRLAVLDFELAPQHPLFDVAYFVESLAHHDRPLVDPLRVQRLERAFLAGHGTRPDDPLLALFRLRHLSCAYVSETRRAGWAQWRAWPGMLALRRRLARVLATLEPAAAVHAA